MKISRKNFITRLAGATAAASLLPSVLKAERNNHNLVIKEKTALVIGAGLAGLTAAYQLKKKGYKVRVIEAAKNPGGRVKSYYGYGLVAELGGEWISSDQKEINNLISELGLETEAHKYKYDLALDNQLGSWDLSRDYGDLTGKLVNLYRNMSSGQKEGLDKISFYNYLNYQGVMEKDLLIADLQYGISYGESIRHISAEKVLHDLANKSNRFGRETVVKGGNYKLIQALAGKTGRFNITYSDPVVKIQQDAAGVKVKTRSGKTHEAEICVFTVPPAAMHGIEWSPDLPREKVLSAIQLKYGRIAKNLLIVDKQIITRDDLAVYTDGPVELFYHASTGQQGSKSVLAAISTGDKADMFNRKNTMYNRQIIQTGLAAAGITADLLSAESRSVQFAQDPFIRGSVSVYSGGTYNAGDILGKPHNRVFFAGEHLGEVTGTMNSAVQSAIAAVDMI